MNAHSIIAPSAHASAADAQRWDDLVSRFEAVEAVPTASLPESVDPDALINLAGDLIGEIMAMPAPHAAAVQWKLDWIVATPNGSEPYEADYVAQLVADYRRFLGGQAVEDSVTAAIARAETYVRSPFQEAYSHYRYARAAWDVEMYLPDRDGADVPAEINDPLMNEHSNATLAVMTAPVGSFAELRQKLDIYREEGVEGWGVGNKLIDALIADVDHLALEPRNV